MSRKGRYGELLITESSTTKHLILFKIYAFKAEAATAALSILFDHKPHKHLPGPMVKDWWPVQTGHPGYGVNQAIKCLEGIVR